MVLRFLHICECVVYIKTALYRGVTNFNGALKCEAFINIPMFFMVLPELDEQCVRLSTMDSSSIFTLLVLVG